MRINYYDGGGDLAKRWYVRITDTIEGRRKTWTYYSDLNQTTLDERHEAAQKKVDEFKELAKGGWHPKKDLEVYRDDLSYCVEKQRDKVQLYDIRSQANSFLQWFIVGKRKKTIQQRTSKLRTFVEWCEEKGIKYIHQFKMKNAEDYALYLREVKKHHQTTYNQDISQMRSFFAYLAKSNPAQKNFFSDIVKPPKKTQPMLPFKQHIIPIMMEWMQANDPQLLLAVKFIFYCFIRPGELRKLQVKHIDIGDMLIRIPGDIAKNTKSQSVVIPDHFLRDLIQMKISKCNDEDYIISPSRCIAEKPVSANYLYKHHEKMQLELGISKNYTLYCWKSTGAWMALKAGINMRELQIQLRHSSLGTTEEYLKGIGLMDAEDLHSKFPEIGK